MMISRWVSLLFDRLFRRSPASCRPRIAGFRLAGNCKSVNPRFPRRLDLG
jgi:hypothetical protein